MSGLDFDGEYGREYRRRIRFSIPAYDAVLEIGAAVVAASAPDARHVLVVGPGAGEEMPLLLEAMPAAQFTLLEPSEQMLQFCVQQLQACNAEHRCQLKQSSLLENSLGEQRFDVVVCHHVLHLSPPDQQQQQLRALLSRLASGGTLLISSYSEPVDQQQYQQLVAIASARLRMLGMDEPTLKLFLSGRNKVVFSLQESLLADEAEAHGCEPPLVLLRAMLNGLWSIRKLPG